MSEDTISRKAAIDAFLTELTKRERKNLLHTWSTVEVKYFIVEMLEQLQSAQPEIVLCKDCVKRNRKLGSLDEHYNRYNKSQCCPMIEFRGMPQGHEFDYQYCSWAERRTDEQDSE